MKDRQTYIGKGNPGEPVLIVPPPPSATTINEQVKAALDSFRERIVVSVPEILEKIDLSSILPDEHKMWPYHAIGKTDMFKDMAGFDFPQETLDFLKATPNYALKLGFFKDESNNIKLPSKESFNKYKRDHLGPEVIRQLKQLSIVIVKEATKKGIILERKKVKDTLTMEEKIMKTSIKAIKALRNILTPSLCIEIDGIKYNTSDFLRLWIHGARIHKFAHGGGINLKLDHPKDKCMSGDLMLHHMNKGLTSLEQVKEMGDKLFAEIWNRACKQHPQLLRIPVGLAVDWHKQAYYGDPNDDYVVESEPDKGTTHFNIFMTFAVTIPGLRYDLLTIPVHPLDDLSDLLELGLKAILNMGVKIRHVLGDRAFSHVACINVCEKLHLKYIMPIAKNDRIKNYIAKSEGCKVRIVKDYKMVNQKKEVASTELILVNDKDGVTRVFVSNVGLPEPITHLYLVWYSRRWGIETEYRVLEENFRLRTTSKNYLIRYFNFILGISLFNLWQLVNLYISNELTGKLAEEPLLPADHFMVILNKFYENFIEPGGGNHSLHEYD